MIFSIVAVRSKYISKQSIHYNRIFVSLNTSQCTAVKGKVLYMSFDRFLLAIESRDLSQADKGIYYKRVFFPKAE